jgi:hypothetical protein
MATKGLSPLEVLAQQFGQDEAKQESLEHELAALPRWRFRRRLDTERRLKRSRARRARMEQLLQEENAHS